MCERAKETERERECVCVCERERESVCEREGERESVCDLLSREVLYALGCKYPLLLAVVLPRINVFVIQRVTECFIRETG